MIELQIDDKHVTAEDGETIIEAADRIGIYIPRFCYHKKLSIAANCRMCLVEVGNSKKPVAACATPVTADMKVYTTSKVALESQRIVMEFLLENHPLDCPICDQGGECELQDIAMGYGNDASRYDGPKRSIHNEDIGPLIETEMTRCIYCTRCVRFGVEVAGMRELGITNRGGHSEIGTYVKHFLKSELSGNIIDLCPVGALTAKPSRYNGRAWQMQEHKSIAPHDCVGSNIYIHTRLNKVDSATREVMRVVPRENEALNEVWISDRDRFSYEALQHQDRITKPRAKKNGGWVDVNWREILLEIADKTLAVAHNQSPDQIAALASPNCTTEEFYLLQKIMRELGSNNIDHRLRESDFSDQEEMPEFLGLGMQLSEIDALDALLLVGSNVRFEQPIISQRIYKACHYDTKAMAVNPVDYPFLFPLKHKLISNNIVRDLYEIAQAVDGVKDAVSDSALAIAEQLRSGEKAAIYLGAYAMQHPKAAKIRQLAHYIAEKTGASVGILTTGANSAGAWLAGAVPHRSAGFKASKVVGKNAKQLLSGEGARVYFLLNFQPEFDAAYSADALKTLKEAGMVVCLTPFVSKAMEEYADYILPIAPFSETDGSFVNVEGKMQHFSAATIPIGSVKPAWKVLRVFANFMQLDNFEYDTAHQIRHELQQQLENAKSRPVSPVEKIDISDETVEGLQRIAAWPIYRSDALVRSARALQETPLNEPAAIVINKNLAAQLNVVAGDQMTAVQVDSRVTLPVQIDDAVADGLVSIAAGLEATAAFGVTMGPIELVKGGA